MKNSIKTLAVLAILGFAGTAFAQNSATATATGTVIKALTVTDVSSSSLNFGTSAPINAAGANGTVHVNGGTTQSYAAGTQYGTNNANVGGSATGPADFNISGDGAYAINIVTALTGYTGPAGSSIVLDATPTSFAAAGWNSGNEDIYVGGTFSYLASTLSGTGTGTITMTATYQ
jgi:hypothetical protein